MTAARTALSIIAAAAMLAACGESVRIPIERTPPTPPAAPSSAAPLKRQLPQGFIDLSDVDSTILLDIRYHSAHNFAGRRIGGRSPHSRGSTVDLTLVALPPREQRAFVPGEPLTSCAAPVEQRFPDNTIDMGTGYDCFDTRSHTLDGRVSTAARANRLLLRQIMADAGFRNYAKEWWHYRLAAEPYPDAYFDFPVGTGSG